MRTIATAALIVLVALAQSSSLGAAGVENRSLDGSGNNVAHPDWGRANTPYLRVASTNYADHVKSMVGGPSARYVSNRVFNDVGQNVFSENGVSQWGWLWGQFLDHTFGLRDERAAESAPIPYDAADPLERFRNDFPGMNFARTPIAPGTGTSAANPRQQTNTVSSYVDAFAVYGGTQARLDWLRDGASLLLPHGFLPRANARGDVASAPPMDLMGPLFGNPAEAVVAGDVRANENIGLTATHTLFAREHNRIVAALPDSLSAEDKFQIARRVVGAEEQYITYREFLPALGVPLAPYTGYRDDVNASLSNEFATVGYRAHSQIHGEMEPNAAAGRYTAAQLDAFRHEGIDVEEEDGRVALVIPLGVTFGNPDLLEAVGVGPLLRGLALERQYKNDEQIDDSLRSILFQIPKPGIPDPRVCGEPVVNPDCFSAVQDLGAIDVQRGRDHGMPYYNDLRVAYGLAPKTSFAAITGEASDAFPPGVGVDSPSGLDFTSFVEDDGTVVGATRRAPLAARLKAIYGTVDRVDAFVGMVAEPHVAGSELGELQLAMWKKQFEALRDGDRFFYANDPFLDTIRDTYGIDYRHSLADVIEMNTGVDVPADVFHAPPEADEEGPRSGLVGAYGFDEGAGTAVHDASGLGNDGTARDTAWVDGKFGSALSFNGSTSWVTIPDNGSLDLVDGLTLEAWVRPTALGTTWRTVAFKERPGGNAYALYANDAAGRPVGQVQIGGEQGAEGSAALPAGTWTHLAVTYDGSSISLYVNGALASRQPQTGAIDVSARALRIGGNSVWPEWFKGAIDEVRVYNRPLSVDEIREDLAAAVGAVPAPELPAFALGDRRVESDANAEPAGTAEAYPATAPADATVSSVSVYLDAASTATAVHAGIYSADSGHPARLLGEAALEFPVAGAWNTIALPELHLAAGTRYWLALLAPDGTLVFRDRCCTVTGSTATEQSAQTSLRGLPAVWTPGARWDDGPMSVYASG